MKKICLFPACIAAKRGVVFIPMNKSAIGQAIAERRNTLDISQARLAKLSGVSVHTISNIETGVGNVTIDTLLKITEVLGFHVKVGP